MKTTINILIVCVLALFISQCEVVSENLLQNPNAPSPENLSADFLLNNIQLETPDLFINLEGEGSEVSRMTYMSGDNYSSAYQAQFFDGDWNTAYENILRDVETLIPRATERNLFSHVGIARVIKAYTLLGLVDKFGDVPLEEALDASNFNPDVTEAPAVYAAAIAELDSAIIALEMDEAALPQTDVFYGDASDRDEAWIRLANTLKLKALYQQRLVSDNASEINSLLSGDVDIIDEPGEEWVFGYSTNNTNPDSRHPDYAGNYTGTGTALGAYMSVYYMNQLWNGKNNPDPRIRYYLYRQTSAVTTDPNEQNCINNPPPTHYAGSTGSGVDGNDPFCEDWNSVGYWGRDHGRTAGIPPDQTLRTTYGVYPAGGQFDANQASSVAVGIGLGGAGITPLWMPFYTDFVRAEVEFTINGNDAAAQTALEDGIRNSIEFVTGVGMGSVTGFAEGNNPTGTNLISSIDGASDFVPTQAAIDQYVTEVLGEYNSVDMTNKLNIIGREFYLALWGNGLEAYNVYRRIAPEGRPTSSSNVSSWDLQPHLNDTPGEFYLSFTYPAAFTDRNSSVSAKDGNDIPVFWFGDNNVDFADF